jgi:hypothetical protein
MFRVRMFAALVLLGSAFQLLARDVSVEQNAVQYARRAHEQIEAEHKADVEQASLTKEALVSLRKKYDAEKKKAALSAKKKQQAKANLDKAQAALDAAWKR